MDTEVILMEDVAKLGAAGDVVRVSPGFARNYLLPKSMAAPVSEATRRKLAKLQIQRAETRKVAFEADKALLVRVEALSCTIPVKTADGDKLYGSVTAADISAACAILGVELDKGCIELETPIKALGVFSVPVRLQAELRGTLKVWVVEE